MTALFGDNLSEKLKNDLKVKVAGIDADGILRGKVMAKEKFLSTVMSGFGFSSAVFGWDMHDALLTSEVSTDMATTGYTDITAVADLASFRRLPWENDMPFFLLHFLTGGKSVAACPRGVMSSITKKLAVNNFKALAGVELEFVNFQTPTEDGYGAANSGRPDLAAFLSRNSPGALRPITQGMFGYSITRPTASKEYFNKIFDASVEFGCNLEVWHTESGPGVFEAALSVRDAAEMADRVTLFKLLTKSTAIDYNITPCFMAKPFQTQAGNSGHIHVSLTDDAGKNLFAAGESHTRARWPDLEMFSKVGYHFLAGILDALPDIMPLLAPTVNSYKRFVENFWAPVLLTWGLEDRLASIRLIAPPTCKASATRMEIRIPGADLHPHYALAAIFAAGLRGIQKELEVTIPPNSARAPTDGPPMRLAKTLQDAVDRFAAPTSVARELFPDELVDFFAATREHELRLWREAVTDWEITRYIETI